MQVLGAQQAKLLQSSMLTLDLLQGHRQLGLGSRALAGRVSLGALQHVKRPDRRTQGPGKGEGEASRQASRQRMHGLVAR